MGSLGMNLTDTRFKDWISENHQRFTSLTQSAMLIVENLLNDERIQYLKVDGRTKSLSGCLEKAKRKKYKKPALQMTDISGIRVIVYFEYDVKKVCQIIENTFRIDWKNSLNKYDGLSANELGYRSVHYVCDLGDERGSLREHKNLKGLQFEIQVRTVLQHAWAEIAHDRNYKFSGKLPKHIERKLYLLSGLLETADSGFGDLSLEIDQYVHNVENSSKVNEIDKIELNSLSLEAFVREWAKRNSLILEEFSVKSGYSDLISELDAYGVKNLTDLNSIVPEKYAETFKSESNTILGFVRDWMVLNDVKRFLRRVKVDWVFTYADRRKYKIFLTEGELAELNRRIGFEEFDHNSYVDESYIED